MDGDTLVSVGERAVLRESFLTSVGSFEDGTGTDLF